MTPFPSRRASYARPLALALLLVGCDSLPGRDLPSSGDGAHFDGDPAAGDGDDTPPPADSGTPPDAGQDGGSESDGDDAGTPPTDFDAGPPPPMNFVRVEAEDFLPGPDGYHDTTPENQGGGSRLEEAVDVGLANDWEFAGGLSVGYTRPGEWLTYALNLTETSAYTLRVRVAHETGGGQFSVLVDDRVVTTFTVPSTGNWSTWVTLERPLGTLSEGAHVLKITVDTAGLNGTDAGNLNFYDFVPVEGDGGVPPVDDAGAPDDASVPDDGVVRVETEDFLPGPDGYSDTTPENQGGFGRLNEGVDVEFAGDPLTPGSLSVAYTRPGEWLRYDLTLRRTAQYTLRARVAHANGGGAFSVWVDEQQVGTFTIPATGAWSNWTTVEAPLGALSAGPHALKLMVDSAGVDGTDAGNLNFLEFVPGEEIGSDAGVTDAGAPEVDAGSGMDAGAPEDAGPAPIDGGAGGDAGTPSP